MQDCLTQFYVRAAEIKIFFLKVTITDLFTVSSTVGSRSVLKHECSACDLSACVCVWWRASGGVWIRGVSPAASSLLSAAPHTLGLSHLHTLNINTLLSRINDSIPECIITCVHMDIPCPPGKHTQTYNNMKKRIPICVFLERYCQCSSFFCFSQKLTSMTDRVCFIPVLSHLSKLSSLSVTLTYSFFFLLLLLQCIQRD